MKCFSIRRAIKASENLDYEVIIGDCCLWGILLLAGLSATAVVILLFVLGWRFLGLKSTIVKEHAMWRMIKRQMRISISIIKITVLLARVTYLFTSFSFMYGSPLSCVVHFWDDWINCHQLLPKLYESYVTITQFPLRIPSQRWYWFKRSLYPHSVCVWYFCVVDTSLKFRGWVIWKRLPLCIRLRDWWAEL